MELPPRKRGRPVTRQEDWESTQKRTRLSTSTFQRWRELKNNLALPSDDSVASYLLSVYSKFVIHSDGQEGPFERGNDNPLQSPIDETESFHEHQDEPSRIQFSLSNRSYICMENERQEDSTR